MKKIKKSMKIMISIVWSIALRDREMNYYIELLELLNELSVCREEDDIRFWDGDPSVGFSREAEIRSLHKREVIPPQLDIVWFQMKLNTTVQFLMPNKSNCTVQFGFETVSLIVCRYGPTQSSQDSH